MDSTGIANLALGRLGVGQVIASITENTVPAKTCNRFYEQCRQEVLRAHPWGFALRAEPLAEVAGETFPGWVYVYQYPSGCLMMRAIGDDAGIRQLRSLVLTNDPLQWDIWPQYRAPWQVALKADNVSQILLTDVQTAWGFFTVDVTNPGVYPADFTSCLADRLAAEVGGPLQAKADLISKAESRYLFSISRAAAASMSESRDDIKAESPSISCRA